LSLTVRSWDRIRRERNEPANIRYALKAIAEIKEVTEQTAAAAIDENHRRLYGL